MIHGGTRFYAILGQPVKQALSPIVQNAAFSATGWDGVMLGLEVRPQDLATAFQGLRACGVSGLAVTMPHKKDIIPLLDEVDAHAALLEAVNVVECKDGRYIGHNTDGQGFCRGLGEQGVELSGKRVFLFGAGGAARSIAVALADSGIASLTICNIFEEEIALLRDKLDSFAMPVKTAPFGKEAAAAMAEADIIVNATSMGMADRPATYLDFIDWTSLREGCMIADIVHKPLQTPLLERARAHGFSTMSGDRMLLHQGTLAFTCWTGQEAPVEVMDDALKRWVH